MVRSGSHLLISHARVPLQTRGQGLLASDAPQTPTPPIQVLHTQLAEQQQLRQAAEQGCTAAQAEALAARQAAADHQGAAQAALTEAEQRATAAAKAARRADTAAAVAAAQRQQAEQTSDQFQRRLHEVQMQLRMQQQQERALREHIAKVRTCMLTASVSPSSFSHAAAVYGALSIGRFTPSVCLCRLNQTRLLRNPEQRRSLQNAEMRQHLQGSSVRRLLHRSWRKRKPPLQSWCNRGRRQLRKQTACARTCGRLRKELPLLQRSIRYETVCCCVIKGICGCWQLQMACMTTSQSNVCCAGSQAGGFS